jgi:hypothetical protein
MLRGLVLHLSLLAPLVQAALSATLLAGVGSVSTLPASPRNAKHGLLMTVDTRWVEGNGYRPIRIHLRSWPPGPAPADRVVEVELRVNSWSDSRFDIAVRTAIELPQGSTGVVHTVSTPQWQEFSLLQVETWEDGRKLEELCERLSIRGGADGGYSEGVPSILIVDRKAPSRGSQPLSGVIADQSSGEGLPDISELLEFLPADGRGARPARKRVATPASPELTSKIEVLAPDDLPERWIDYTCFDLVFISFQDLRALTSSHPGPWGAIRDWAATGPTLCVYDAGQGFERLEELERLLELAPLFEPGKKPPAFRGWTAPIAKNLRETVPAFEKLKEFSDGAWPAAAEVEDPEEAGAPKRRASQPPAPQPPTFVFRQLNLGAVVAFGPKQAFPGDQLQWAWLFNTLPTRQWMWYQRHGASLQRPNVDYWNFLIPGVGLAPVKSFLLFISLFAAIIGPVNYLLLRRWRRLHLLLVTVPAGAAIVVLGLLGWALIRDGLGVRARIRSFTEIDQRQGRAVSWSRQSYYAGLVPSGGLSFPANAAVYPLEYLPRRRELPSAIGRRLAWGERQHYTAGYVQPRVTSQFMVTRSRRTKAGLSISWPEGQESPPAVENGLGARVLELFLLDGNGRGYWAGGIDPGARFRLQAAALEPAAARLRQVLAEHRPANPPKFDPIDFRRAFGFGFNPFYYYWGWDEGLPEPSTEQGVLETNLNRLAASGLRRLNPRSYVAIVESSSETPLGFESAREEASLHVVLGRW